MSAFASPSFEIPHPPVFPVDSRYVFRSIEEDDAKIIAFTQVSGGTRLALDGLHKRLGQYSVDNRTCGVLFTSEIAAVLATFGITSRKACYNWRKRLVEAELLEWMGDGYRIRNYEKANRTAEQWAELDAKRRERRRNGQNLRREKARLEGRPQQKRAFSVPAGGTHVPIAESRSPDTPTLSDISGGEAQQLSRLHPTQIHLSPKTQASTQRPRSQPRDSLDLRTPPPTGTAHRSKTSMDSLASVLNSVLPDELSNLGGARPMASSAPLAPKPAQAVQPRPLSKTLGSNKFEDEQRHEGASFMERALRLVANRQAERAAEAKSKAAKQASP